MRDVVVVGSDEKAYAALTSRPNQHDGRYLQPREVVVADVFVSYAAKDRDRVAPLVEALRTSGLSVWWDRGIDVGSRFDREIERELDAAGCVVVVWSTESIESEWVRTETLEAQSRDALVPMLIDDVKPPLASRREQAARMFEWPHSSAELDALLRAVRAKHARRKPDLGSAVAHSSVATSTRSDASPSGNRQGNGRADRIRH